MSFLESALKLGRHGLRVFPLTPNSKIPIGLLDHFKDVATTDPEKIKRWWLCPVLGIEQPFNIGISTRGFLVLDVDNKKGRDGDGDILKWELEDKELPDTYTQFTPTGGRHLFYRTERNIGNGRRNLPSGIDIRGHGGLCVGAGSEVDGGLYTADFAKISKAPTWLEDLCTENKAEARLTGSIPRLKVDEKYAESRAVDHLKGTAGAVLGARGSAAYKIAAYLKDLGVSSFSTYDLMAEYWAERCEPPINDSELIASIEHAYRYGKNEIGAAAPEADFQPVLESSLSLPVPESKAHPIEDLNKEYAFIIVGSGHIILRETVDELGNFKIMHLREESFHKKFAGEFLSSGDGKTESLSQKWIKSLRRRSYDGFCFRPGQQVSPRFYNLWRGFSVEPCDKDSAPAQWNDAVSAFLEHTRENVCGNDLKLTQWLLGYFAHLIQRPWERPDVAIVFRGKKGVGKNALVERVGYLLGQHFGVAADQRYLAGNFNAHLENKLLFVLDEAFWSGDKKVDGILKHLVTGEKHNIERKGQEAYTVTNCLRVAIMGNDDWLIPASDDERRYAVFDVGSGRKQDRKFFRDMRIGMEAGGYRVLLKYFLDFDLSTVDVGEAPKTAALLSQKYSSLDMVGKWWGDCLHAGEIDGMEWSPEISKEAVREAFRRHARNINNRSRLPEDVAFGRTLVTLCPSIRVGKKRAEGSVTNVYKMPTLEEARAHWEKHLGHPVDWKSFI